MLVANITRIGHEAAAAAIVPPEAINYLAFAEQHIVFRDGEPQPGPYDRKAFGYFDEVLRALGPDDPARIVTLMASARIGKTILGNIFALGSVVMGRGTVLIVHPGLEGASRWSRMKLAPMMRAIPIVASLFPNRPRDASDAILFKERIDGLGNILISEQRGEPVAANRPVRARRRSREMGAERRRRSRASSRQPSPRPRVRQDFQDFDAVDLAAVQDHAQLSSRKPRASARSLPALRDAARLALGKLLSRASREPLFQLPGVRRRDRGTAPERHAGRVQMGCREPRRCPHASELLALVSLQRFAKLGAARGGVEPCARRRRGGTGFQHRHARARLSAQGRRQAGERACRSR